MSSRYDRQEQTESTEGSINELSSRTGRRRGSRRRRRISSTRSSPLSTLQSTLHPSILLALVLIISVSGTIGSPSDALPPPTEPGPSPVSSAIQAQATTLTQPQLSHNYSDISPADYACQPIGPCQPCPIDELSNPVCQIYHNRRLVDCIYLGSSSPALIASILRNPSTYATGLMIHHTSIEYLPTTDSSSTTPTTSTTSSSTSSPSTTTSESKEPSGRAPRTEASHQDDIGTGMGAAEFQTWEACERVVLKEQQDFYEFVLCNVAIAILSLIVYGFRTKQLVIKQYGKLAARIGILPS
ncbi:hypothetical protein PGTUg99_014380 [Puccinia graminis f. sp. tritici]|uniref:Uncharacterized protein n=1 Tax=Puccinia graminis f. sp. tritici TaxID=56615 RepID=A0A5B0LRF1_PUCGR|nr:hypothetical protein PGTUg99_014380 [Puccinia graminis f. sp. tritici]